MYRNFISIELTNSCFSISTSPSTTSVKIKAWLPKFACPKKLPAEEIQAETK
jgi:hypothetical protein